MERFTCLGGACPDTCCSGWKVPIDRRAHQRLLVLATDRPALREKIESAGEFDDGAERGTLRFGSDGRCGLLTDGGLCSVHGEFGEDALHDVCRIYPRLVTSYGDHVEHFGALSCPEVLRLVLERNDSLELIEAPFDAPRLHRHRLSPNEPYSRPFLLVRAGFITLLDDEADELGARLFSMLYVASQLSEFLRPSGSPLPNEAYAELLAALVAPARRKSLAATWAELPSDEVTAQNLATQILLTERPGNERFRRLALELRRTLSLDDAKLPLADDELEGLVTRARERKRTLAASTRGEIRRALTLYAKNHLLTHPYVEESSPLRWIFALALRLAALAVFLEGSVKLAASAAETRAALIDAITAFARHLEHSKVFDGLLEELDRQGLVSLAVGTSLSRLL